MGITSLVTPNGVKHKVKENSWYVVHIMTRKGSDAYTSLKPEMYRRDDGSIRYRFRLPVLLSITSTDDNEVLMDVADVCRCFEVPYSKYLRMEMVLDGREVSLSSGHAVPNENQCRTKDNSYYVLHVDKMHVDDFERLNPEPYRLEDGRVRYRVRLPMLFKTKTNSNDAAQSRHDIDQICKYFNVPSYGYEYVQMYVHGEEVEHPSNQWTQRSYILPAGAYFIGDPLTVRVISDHDGFLDAFDPCAEFFQFCGHQIVSIPTGADGEYPLYAWDEDWKEDWDEVENGKRHADSDSPVLVDCLLTDLAMLAIIPLDLLHSIGVAEEEIDHHGFTFEVESSTDDSEAAVFDVTFYAKGGILQHVELLDFILLIEDKYRFDIKSEADEDEDMVVDE